MLNVAETNIQHAIRIVNPGMCEIKREHACVVVRTHAHLHFELFFRRSRAAERFPQDDVLSFAVQHHKFGPRTANGGPRHAPTPQ